MATLYIGCSLTQATPDFITAIDALKNELRKKHTVMDFIGLVGGTEHDVYHNDIHKCVATCDALVAICDLPSLGLGYELGTAIEKLEKPTLMLAHQDSKITRLLLGIEKPFVEFVRYQDHSEIPALVDKFIAEHLLRS